MAPTFSILSFHPPTPIKHDSTQIPTQNHLPPSPISEPPNPNKMKLWQRVSGAMKDRNSLWLASLAHRHQFRNPALEAALIKATSHDERLVDYKNTQRVFAWIRTSPSSLLPFLVSLSRRLSRTHSPTVAIKGLILFHGVLSTNIPSSRKIGRLPFDLSGFNHSFVRSYFAFLDRKSVNLSSEFNDSDNDSVSKRLAKLDRWQDLLDLVLQIRPGGRGSEVVVLEAMDCVIIEVFDVYSKICDGIANVMIRIYAAAEDSEKAEVALGVLRRATRQAEELSDFFDVCKGIGLLSESECPEVEKVSEEDVRELERIINGGQATVEEEVEEEGSGVVESTMKTVITDKWEVFEEEIKVGDLIDLSDDDYNNTAIVPVYDGFNYNYNHNYNYNNYNNNNYNLSEYRQIYI